MHPKTYKPSCPIAKFPTEVLMMTLEHLDLKDVFVARFVCKDFHAIASSISAKREKEAKDAPAEIWNPQGTPVARFRKALEEATWFYEKTLTTKPLTLWCNRCRQIRDRRSFSDSQYFHPHEISGRFCWRCSYSSGRIFKLEGVQVCACAGISCTYFGKEKTHRVSLGYWQHKSRMICVGCWPEYRRSLPFHRPSDRCTPVSFSIEQHKNDITTNASSKHDPSQCQQLPLCYRDCANRGAANNTRPSRPGGRVCGKIRLQGLPCKRSLRLGRQKEAAPARSSGRQVQVQDLVSLQNRPR